MGQQLTHQYTSDYLGALCEGCLQAEVHQLSRLNAGLSAENMQMKHELQQARSTQQQLVASKQVGTQSIRSIGPTRPSQGLCTHGLWSFAMQQIPLCHVEP